ncbi:wolframin isoform X1 [Tachysurus fulvidraco]|uniref:wolframin isoform X1 n=1 Tax=Tachysurus fulvidraco TaxID=1234273 RepID=UPI000F512B6D|nr:wolframin isoform X1 [Tachysurus fulvidraco]XP_027032038.1 wolframin isoform X1 [Tachysurus fulvidraco]
MDVLRPVCGKKTVSPDDPSLPPLTSPPLMKDSSHSPVVTARPSHGQVRRGFAAVAKRVIQEERKRKEEKQDRVEQEEESAEEDLSFEELLEKAKAGDPKAQSNLGKYHLKLGEDCEADVNNQIAVDWLVRAAKQGRGDAAKLLQHCWTLKKGITQQNEAEVRSLSRESKFEQAVRRAAMTMYWKLNPDRKEKMDKREILQNVSQVNSETGADCIRTSDVQTQRKVLEAMVSEEPNSQYVDVEGFVEMTKKYTENITQTPESKDTVSRGVCDWDDLTTLDKQKGVCPVSQRKSVWPGRQMMLETKCSMKKAIDIQSYFLGLQYPLHLILDVKEHLVDWASRAGVQWLSTIIPTQHVNALVFFFIISNLTVDIFFFFIPLLTFYLAFISMAICTLRVFRSSKCWQNFSALAALLRRFEPELDIQSHFGWGQLEQHLYFLVSVCFVIFSFPLADKRWIPCSELCTVAMFFTALSYASLTPAAASYTRRAFIIEVASSLCALTTRLPQEFRTLRLLGQTFATVPVGELVVLTISLPCLLYLYLFYLFFSMARMHGFRGTYCFLVPYLVCFMWLEFAVVLLQNSTLIGLIRTCVAYFLFLFALPVLAMGLAAMLMIQMVKWFVELELTKMLVTLAVCVVPVTLRLWTRFSLSILSVLHSITHRGPVKLILLCLCCVFLVCLGYVYSAEGLKVYNSTLTWEQYNTVCGPPAWKQYGIPHTQILCSHLEGHRVTWSGWFLGVRVAETENGAQSLINLLPVFMGDWLRCLYGDEYPSCERQNVSNSLQEQTSVNASVLFHKREEEELCRIKHIAKHHCHVKRFDKYRFEVTLRHPVSGAEIVDSDNDIILLASHEFKQVLLNLNEGSMVEFSTKLEGKLGSKLPRLELKAIHCLNCTSSLLPEGRQVKIERNWRKSVQAAIKFAFDFFFSPLLSARIKV